MCRSTRMASPGGTRRSPISGRRARARDNLTVIGDALVDRVLLDGRRARGAVALVAGERVDLSAELVIVSAGAFGSPGVLMRSGIGAGDQLAGLGIASMGVGG